MSRLQPTQQPHQHPQGLLITLSKALRTVPSPHHLLTALLTLSIITPTAQAQNAQKVQDPDVYTIEIERQGKTYNQTAARFWQGEYPGPVIDVLSKHSKKTTTIQAWDSLRNPQNQRSCTIQNGLYHPWSKTANSVLLYYTIDELLHYRVRETLNKSQLDALGLTGINIKAGDDIRNVVYLGEGTSIAMLYKKPTTPKPTTANTTNSTNTPVAAKIPVAPTPIQIEIDSNIFDNNPQLFSRLQHIKTVGKTREQWLYLKCGEGYNAYIRDLSLLKHKGVRQGEIKTYGEIKRAG